MEKIKEIGSQIRQFINSLNPDYVALVALLFMLLVAVLVLILVNHMIKSGQIKKQYRSVVDKNKEAIEKSMRGSKLKAFSYDEIEAYISRSGLGYMTDDKINPVTYMILKIFFAIFFMIVGLQENLWLGLILLPVGYFGLDFIINESDKSDNIKMLDDIKNVYDTLRIQTKAGVYITSVITDCYLVVQNKRLKKAFLKLTSDIVAKNDIESALDDFRNKFNNEYIDTLVIIIKQSMKTGQASKMFDDIRNQITDIESAMVMHEKTSIQSKITFCQILLYVAIIVVSLYIAVVTLASGLLF